MLVPEVVDVPGLVGDHQVIAALVDRVLEDHEVLDQHLVHAPQRLEDSAGRARRRSSSMCRVSLASRALSGCTRSPFASSNRVTGSCASQSTCRSGDSAQLARDGQIAPAVAEADRRGQVERALFPASRAARLPAGAARPSLRSRSRRSARWPSPDSGRADCARRSRSSPAPRPSPRRSRPARAHAAGSGRRRRG